MKLIEELVNKGLLSQDQIKYLKQIQSTDYKKFAKLIRSYTLGGLSGLKTFLNNTDARFRMLESQAQQVGNSTIGQALKYPVNKPIPKLAGLSAADIALTFTPTPAGKAKVAATGAKVLKEGKALNTIATMSKAGANKFKEVATKELDDLIEKSIGFKRFAKGPAKDLTLKQGVELLEQGAPKLKAFENNPLKRSTDELFPKIAEELKPNTQAGKGFEKIQQGKEPTKEQEEALTTLFKNTSKELNELVTECGVKKSELGQFMNFIKGWGTIISKAPVNIKTEVGEESLGGLAGIINKRDLWTSFKDAKFSWKAMLATGIGGVTLAGLGYGAKDALSKASTKELKQELEINDQLTDQQIADKEAGLLDESLIGEDEIFTGATGKKYHVLNGYAYDYSTGKRVILEDMVKDVEAAANQAQDQVKKNNEIIDYLQSQEQQSQSYGYAPNPVTQQEIDRLKAENESLKSNVEQSTTIDNLTGRSYQVEGKSAADVYKENAGRKQAANDSMAQELLYSQNSANQQIQFFVNTFNAIQQDTAKNVIDYYNNPNVQQMATLELYQAQQRNQIPLNMTPEQYINYKVATDLRQLQPQFQQEAINMLKQTMSYDLSSRGLNVDQQKVDATVDKNINDFITTLQKNQETARHNLTTEQVQQYNAAEGHRHNVTTEGLSQFNANIDARYKAGQLQNQQQSNEIRGRQVDINERALPYQQFANVGEGVSNFMFGGSNPDILEQANPQLYGQVFPGPQQQKTIKNRLQGE